MDDGYILLLGVRHQNNTSLHLAEYRYQINQNIKKSFILGASVLNPESNIRQWIEWNDYDYDSEDFNDVGNAFELIEGNAKIGKVGLAECRLMKQHLLVDFATNWMDKNRPKQKNQIDS
jgi:aminoglycoside 3-N-acetyltransferase